mmetsp:Transcript_5672/g.15056  ORF Transcript_5672/g.15056 Transcript_5672/m.15056 type:complete len:451 (+) Transcript_5672:362-1714(+)
MSVYPRQASGVKVGRASQLALLTLHDAQLDFRAEGADETLHGPCGSVAERADRVPLNLVRQLLEHVDLLDLGVACHQAVHDFAHPGGALAARCALATALVLVKLGEACDRRHDVRRLVKDCNGRGTEARTARLEVVKVHERLVTVVLCEDGDGGAAWDDAEEVVPATHHALAVLLEQLLHWDRHLLLDSDRVVNVTRDAEQLRASVVFAAKACKPLGATAQDGRRDRDCLDVGDGRRAAVKARVRREGRLQPRLSRLPLEGLDQTGLLSADVRAAAPVDGDVKVDARAACILADEPRLVRLGDCVLQDRRFVHKLAADVNVCTGCTHCRAGEQATLNKLVRVVSHDLTVLACARLRLVGVHHQILRRCRVVLRHERPLEATWEASAATAAQARGLHVCNDLLRTHEHKLFGLVPISPLLGGLEVGRLIIVQVGKNTILVRQTTRVSPLRC